MKKTLICGLAALLCAGSALAANQDTGNVNLIVIQPLNITHGDLNFGRVGHNGAPCIVIVNPDYTSTGDRLGSTCYLAAGVWNQGNWNVTGDPGVPPGSQTYTVEMVGLPAANDMTGPGPTTIPVSAWTLDDDDNNLASLGDGAGSPVGGNVLDDPTPGNDAFSVGATATLLGTEPAGAYAGTFTLKATYP